jgi:ParB family chromosome partitioning protein
MTAVKRGLGRGLDALFGSNDEGTVTADIGASREREAAGVREVDIDLIAPNPEQPRTQFPAEKLRQLADSIVEHGVIQPLLVSRDPGGGLRLIAGERRLQAARQAGLHHVPVLVREAAGAELLELALVENIQRADLNPIEEATAFRRLTDEYGLTQEEVARRVGRSRATIANSLRLLALEPELRRSLAAGEISEGHARALLSMRSSRERLDLWRAVTSQGLSVRETEARARHSPEPHAIAGRDGGRGPTKRDAELAELESRLRGALSTRVTVTRQRRGGTRIVIDCFTGEELAAVVGQILGDRDER